MPDTVFCIVRSPHSDLAPIVVRHNGRVCTVPYNRTVEISNDHYTVLLDSSFPAELADDLPPMAGNGAAGEPGGFAGGAAFDAEAIIAGTVVEVTAELAGLTLEQLTAVSQAELDREVPRKGVRDALIDAAELLETPTE